MKWFRFYHDAIDDPKVQRLPGDVFKFWVNLLCLASRSAQRGVITTSIEDIAFDVRLDDDTAASMMAELIRRGLIEEFTEGYGIHNWDARQFKSDNVNERVERYRERQRNADETLQETLHVTPDETLKPSVNSDPQNYRDSEGVNPQPPKRKRKSKPTLTDEQLVRFERWYGDYPRKVNRAKAEEAWAAIDPDDELTDVMVSKTHEWAASHDWTKDGGQYVPYPASWLNGRRWTDGAPPRPPIAVHIGGKANANGVYRTPGELMQRAEEERIRGTS